MHSLPPMDMPAVPDSTRRVFTDRARRRAGGMDQGLLSELIGYNLRRAQVSLFQGLQTVLAQFDVTPGQFGVLYLIHRNPGASQSDLGAALGIDRSSMVAVIDRLEKRGLVVRAPSPEDRRSYALQLSANGEEVVRRMVPLVEQHDRAIARLLSDAEQAELLGLLRRIGDAGASGDAVGP